MVRRMILVFGTICIDRVRRVAKLPAPGGYVDVQGQIDLLGGEAANTAVALTRWGVSVRLAGNALGAEAAGIEAMLREKGVVAECPIRPELPTPVCDIFVTPDGERTMFGQGFQEMDEVPDPQSLIYPAGEWFTVEPNMATTARTAARLAHEAGMKLYQMDFVRPDDLIPEGSYWQSSTDWAGTRGNTQRNVEWIQGLVDRTGCFGILSDGPNGFVAGSPNHAVRAYPPYPAPQLVDSTGAGDMFRAGMLFGLDQGWDPARCLQFASAAGCLKCRALGATTDVPTKEEIEAHIVRHESVSRQYW